MAGKFHLSPKTNDAEPCTANGKCPYGGAIHGTSKEEVLIKSGFQSVPSTVTSKRRIDAKDYFREATEELLYTNPRIGSIVRSLGFPIVSTERPTAWVQWVPATKKIAFHINPDFIQNVDLDEMCGVVAHEAHHVYFKHLIEKQDVEKYSDAQAITIAQEIVINDRLVETEKMSLPNGCLRGEDYIGQSAKNMSTEEAYELLAAKNEEKKQEEDNEDTGQQSDDQDDSQSSGSGSGGSGAGDKKVCGKPTPTGPCQRPIGKDGTCGIDHQDVDEDQNGGGGDDDKQDNADEDKDDKSGGSGSGDEEDDKAESEDGDGDDKDGDSAKEDENGEDASSKDKGEDDDDGASGGEGDSDEDGHDHGEESLHGSGCSGIQAPSDPDVQKQIQEQIQKMFEEAAKAEGITPEELLEELTGQKSSGQGGGGGGISNTGRKVTGVSQGDLNWRNLLAKINPKVLEAGARKKTTSDWSRRPRALGGMSDRIVIPDARRPKGDKGRGDTKPTMIIALDQSGSIGRDKVEEMEGLLDKIPEEYIDAYPVTWAQDLVPYDKEKKEVSRYQYGTDISLVEDYAKKIKEETGSDPYILVISDGDYYQEAENRKKIGKGWFHMAVNREDEAYFKGNGILSEGEELFQWEDFKA